MRREQSPPKEIYMLKTTFSRSPSALIGPIFAVGAVAGCASLTGGMGPQALAVIAPTSAAAAASMNPQGSVKFVQHGNAVQISGRIAGLLPGREHGFHVHEAADCSGDGMGTKGHFNPEGVPHGKHGSHVHHAGDLPSLRADASGVAEFNFMAPKLTVAAGQASVVGRGLIVHRDPDDYTTQPTGNAGPRPGCAVIRAG
jgi:Cu-Zn family superoxide dismutase